MSAEIYPLTEAEVALMIAAMPEELPKFVRWVTARGHRYLYFRTKETGNCRLRGELGSSEFFEHYTELLRQRERLQGRTSPDDASWSAMIDRYLCSAEFKALADCTQVDYARTCAVLEAELGPQPFKFTTRAMLKAVQADFADTPRKAHKLKQMASRLYSWAQEGELVPDGFNPAAGLKRLKRKGGEREIVPWSDAEIAWLLEVAPPHVATPVLLALYTGQRREDIVRMTWQQWQGSEIRVRTSKTRQLLDLPCHPVLVAHLEQLRSSAKVVSLAGPICLSDKGVPFTVNGLSGVLRREVEKHPRLPNNRSMHGLRYAAAARMEQGGASPMVIAEVLGHRTFRMALKYAGARLRAAEGVAAMRGGD